MTESVRHHRVGRARGWLVTAAALCMGATVAGGAVVQTWQSDVVSDPTAAAAAPAAYADAGGTATAVWLQRVGSIDRVAVATRPSATKTWGPAAFVSQDGSDVATIASAVNAKGDAVVVWVVGKTVSESHRWGSGGSWSAPKTLRTATQTVANLSVSMNDKRDAVVAWSESTAVHVAYRNGAAAFGATKNLVTVSTTLIEHVFTGVDPAGADYVAWDQRQYGSKGTYLGVYLAHRSGSSTGWIRSARTNLGYDTRVTSMAVRQSGSALLATVKRTGKSANAVIVPYAISGSSVTPGTAKYFGSASVATNDPVVGMNTKGDAVVAYLQTTNQSTWDLRLASYVRATNTWVAPQTMTSGARQLGLGVAVSFNGIAVATWTESPSSKRRVRASVRRSAGTAWESPVTIDDQSSSAESFELSERGSHFLATWTNGPSGKLVANVGLFDTVAPKVTADFARVLPVKVSVPMSIRATDAMSPVTGYGWVFWDDSPPASGQTVLHRFQRTGSYKVTMKVADGAGNPAKAQVVVKVVDWAAVRGFRSRGSRLTCATSVVGGRYDWRRGSTRLHGGVRHIIGAGDVGKKISCTAYTTKRRANSPAMTIPVKCRIPAVAGKTATLANRALRTAGCRVAVSTVSAGASNVGLALSTNPTAGGRVPNGTVVGLTIGA